MIMIPKTQKRGGLGPLRLSGHKINIQIINLFIIIIVINAIIIIVIFYLFIMYSLLKSLSFLLSRTVFPLWIAENSDDCTVLGNCAASNGNNPEQCSSQLLRDGSLQSRKLFFFFFGGSTCGLNSCPLHLPHLVNLVSVTVVETVSWEQWFELIEEGGNVGNSGTNFRIPPDYLNWEWLWNLWDYWLKLTMAKKAISILIFGSRCCRIEM
jgi:hypothetical protein